MTRITPAPHSQLAIDMLRAEGPFAPRAEALHLFGQFVGAWDMEVVFHERDGRERYQQPGEWHFSWVLDGRAIQDVLVYPNPELNMSSAPGERRIGSTLRVLDPQENVWRVVWLGAVTGYMGVLTGRPVGSEIHIEGLDRDGGKLSWRFTDIQPDRFHWKGFKSTDGGATWWMEQQMLGRRRAA